jgi:DNA-binding protein H-NS
MTTATTERGETDLERLNRLEAEANTIRAQIKADADRERPQALRTVGELIAKHGITRTELNEMVRKRVFAPRPRKAKAVAP